MNRYSDEKILSTVDHTLLSPTATKSEIETICKEALEHNTASVCINSCYVKIAKELLCDKIPICTVIGFPLGADAIEDKVAAARNAVANGATEIDMVANIGFIKSGDFSYVLEDIKSVKAAIGDNILKVIIETCLLNKEEKIKMCHIVDEAKADFIKTSTGFSEAGATFEDIELFYREIGGKVKIKAAGGIKTREDMEKFISLGADRLGSSSAIKILKGQKNTGY